MIMNKRIQEPLVWAAIIGTALVCASARAQSKDQLVQPPTLPLPERGSVAGALSKLAFGAADVARGSFVLPLPIELPSQRGALAAKVIPSYSPEGGISEWGMGFESQLEIRRFRVSGDLRYALGEIGVP